MKCRTIDLVHRHQRNPSLSSLGSGDWGSDVGVSVEDRSTGDQSASDPSDRVRIVAEMAILASTSPEIRALSQRRGEGFQERTILPLPSSSVGSSIGSKSSLSVASLISEESKCGDIKRRDMHNTAGQLADKLAALSFENLRIEAPPTPKREQVCDIATLIDVESKENSPQRQYGQVPTPTEVASAGGHECQLRQYMYLHATRSNQHESLRSCGSISKGNGPPKPLKPVTFTALSPVRRPSMHRRVSFDSLPSPLEIGTSAPAPLCNSPTSERITTPTPEQWISHLSSKLEHNQGTSRRQGRYSVLSSIRSHDRAFFCRATSERANPHLPVLSQHGQKKTSERQSTSSL